MKKENGFLNINKYFNVSCVGTNKTVPGGNLSPPEIFCLTLCCGFEALFCSLNDFQVYNPPKLVSSYDLR